MQTLEELYRQFLGFFPVFLQPVISLVIAIFLVFSIIQVIKRNFIYLILLVVLLPAAIPVLKEIWKSVLAVIKFLLPA